MKKERGRMDESILVCVYYGPNGERLIKRGQKMASMLDCPLYILTVDPLPYDEFDAERSGYIERWQELGEQHDNIDEFLLYDNEKRPIEKVIADVAHKYNITQIIIGQTAQSRWEEITKGSFINVLLREMTFVDLHVVSVDRSINGKEDVHFERGVRAYLVKDEASYRLSFTLSKDTCYKGIFYKEIGTDFNNGVFKFIKNNRTCQVQITEDLVANPEKIYALQEQK